MLDVVAMQVSSSPSVRQGNWQCKKRNLQCKKRKQQIHFTQNQIKIQQCLSPKTYPPAKTRARQSLEPSRQALTVALLAGWSALLAHATFTAPAASLLCEDTSPHNNVDGFLPPRSEFLAHMPGEPPRD